MTASYCGVFPDGMTAFSLTQVPYYREKLTKLIFDRVESDKVGYVICMRNCSTCLKVSYVAEYLIDNLRAETP